MLSRCLPFFFLFEINICIFLISSIRQITVGSNFLLFLLPQCQAFLLPHHPFYYLSISLQTSPFLSLLQIIHAPFFLYQFKPSMCSLSATPIRPFLSDHPFSDHHLLFSLILFFLAPYKVRSFVFHNSNPRLFSLSPQEFSSCLSNPMLISFLSCLHIFMASYINGPKSHVNFHGKSITI